MLSDINSTDVESSVSWNNWLEVPLPNQDIDSCEGEIDCPVIANKPTAFTYTLFIESFWPKGEYPCIWRLKDRATDTILACWKFKIAII